MGVRRRRLGRRLHEGMARRRLRQPAAAGKAVAAGLTARRWRRRRRRSLVECETLLPRNGSALAVIGERREHEQAAVGAGVEVPVRRLVVRREAVVEQHDQGSPGIECSVCNLLFAGTDAGRDQHGTVCRGVEELLLFCGQRVRRDPARHLDLDFERVVEQKAVPHSGAHAWVAHGKSTFGRSTRMSSVRR